MKQKENNWKEGVIKLNHINNYIKDKLSKYYNLKGDIFRINK